MDHNPIALQPLLQDTNTGLPREIFYQPEVIGGSLGYGRESRKEDFWDRLGDEPISLGGSGQLQQRLNDFPILARSVSRQALQYNKKRTYLAIQNRGGASVFIAFGRSATLDGFEIPPGPGFFEPILGTVSSVHVITAGANVALTVIEGFRET